MDWNLAIEKNKDALAHIVAGLFVLVGWNETETRKPNQSSLRGRASLARERGVGRERTQAEGEAENKSSKNIALSSKPYINIGPITRRHLAATLRTAEAALRRLIVLFVNVHDVKAIVRMKSSRPLPDFCRFSKSARSDAPVFNLFDPRKRMVFGFDEERTCLSSTRDARALDCEQEVIKAGNKQSAEKLLRRLAALNHAIKNIPRQAKRLVHLMEQRRKAPAGIKCIGPIRPGFPPGFRARGKDEIDLVLRECHGLMRDLESMPP